MVTKPTIKKKPRGKPFPKGVSGNPRGRPKKDFEAQALVAASTKGGADIISTIEEIMRTVPSVDAKGKPIVDPTAQVRLAAAKALADRLWGTAPDHKSLTIMGASGGAIEHVWVETPLRPLPIDTK